MALLSSLFRPSTVGDEVLLQSIDWLENFPWRQENGIRSEKDKYVICLHVKDFEPKDISVKIVNGYIVVEGKHEEKQDEFGFISRHFVRRYPVPEDCIPDKVESRLSSDGVLMVTAPRKVVAKRDVMIPVTHESKIKSKSKL